MKAFPSSVSNGMGYVDNQQGMDLRDYFAAKAMQANLEMMSKIVPNEGNTKKQAIAILSYEMADEMMEARK